MTKHNNRFAFILLLIWTPLFLTAQSDSIHLTVDPVTISVSRIKSPLNKIPLSVTNVIEKNAKTRIFLCGPTQPSIHDFFDNVPGLFALNANNHAQDIRLSIRGFGARSPFGIRGVKLIVDGIPETTPDGQGQVDNIDLGMIQSMVVVRGPSSGLYGNASGGVVQINTEQLVKQNFLEFSTGMGSYDWSMNQLKAGLNSKSTDLILNLSHRKGNGYRNHNAMEQSMISANIFHHLSHNSSLKFNFNFTHSPLAQDPGGLNLESVTADRSAARDRNVLYDAGESIKHLKTSIFYRNVVSPNSIEFNSFAFYSFRNFEGRLPFTNGGQIDLFRNYLGHGSSLQKTFASLEGVGEYILENKLKIGYEILHQSDDRKRYNNNEGARGTLSFDQLESFTNVALYAIDHFSMKNWVATSEMRFDLNQLKASDQFLSDGDDSDDIQMNAVSYGLSVGYSINEKHLAYARFASSFETPALSELSANPDGSQGFNDLLNPQSSDNFEIGIRGRYRNKLRYELVGFHINTRDEIISFEVADFPGRSFFRNAGKTQRLGMESSLDITLPRGFRSSLNYTYSNFGFKDYQLDSEILDGQMLPGIPNHFGAMSLFYDHNSRFTLELRNRFVGTFFLDDLNSVSVQENWKTSINLTGSFQVRKFRLNPFLRVDNIFNNEYNDNIRINAFGGRYYEPAPLSNFYFGLSFRFQ